jgi:hypothetical protein
MSASELSDSRKPPNYPTQCDHGEAIRTAPIIRFNVRWFTSQKHPISYSTVVALGIPLEAIKKE